MDLSIFFVFYDTLKKPLAFTGKENYIGLEHEVAYFLRPHAASILYWKALNLCSILAYLFSSTF